MRNFNTFDKGLVVGLVTGISITLLLLSLMSEHGPFGQHGPFSSYTEGEIRKSDGGHEENDGNGDEDDDDDEDEDEDKEHEILEGVYFDMDDLIPLTGIIISIGVLAFGTSSLINALRKRNIEESAREDEKGRWIRRLELIEEALLEGRISEETYKELKVKYGEMLNKHK